MNLITIITIGLVLFVNIRILMYFTRIASKRTQINKLLIRIIPVFEFILWTAYVFWAAYVLFEEYSFLPALLAVMGFILSIAIGWYIVRDLVSGMILKTENVFETGQYLKTDFSEGMIKKIGYLSLEMETTKGETIKIPYSKLSNQILIRPQKESSNKYALITLEISKKHNHTDIKEKLPKALNSTPWVIYSRPPEVIISQASEHYYSVEIRFVSFSDEQTSNLKKFLEDYCSETFPN
jgi:small-conductance mechanosensitive channel